MKIIILPGDGIGPEITAATRMVLEALDDRLSLRLDLQERDIGFAALAKTGSTLPDDVLEEVRQSAATILGPIDNYAYPPEGQGGINPSKTLRIMLDLYANIRPARTRPGVKSMAGAMDLVIVRENTEGFYADRNMAFGRAELMPSPDMAIAIRKVTVSGTRRIARQAFELARRRRRRLTVVHKANVFKISDGLFLREVSSIGREYPDVEKEEVLDDAMAALLIRHPQAFDVVLGENLFGDILSDQAAEMAGGLGLGPSINVGDTHVIAQAVHGSAPGIAGRNVANPTAYILSTQMLLEFVAARDNDPRLAGAAALMSEALETVLADPRSQTADLGGTLGTAEFGKAVSSAIERAVY